MLNALNFIASQPKTIAPAIKITIEIRVLKACKSSTSDTNITLQRRDSFVGETVTGCARLLPLLHEFLA